MSTEAKNHTLNRGESYCWFGFDVLSKLLKGFETQIGGVIDNKDVEFVTDAVNSRKIRAVLPLFQFVILKRNTNVGLMK
jgi:hypothetical protein